MNTKGHIQSGGAASSSAAVETIPDLSSSVAAKTTATQEKSAGRNSHEKATTSTNTTAIAQRPWLPDAYPLGSHEHHNWIDAMQSLLQRESLYLHVIDGSPRPVPTNEGSESGLIDDSEIWDAREQEARRLLMSSVGPRYCQRLIGIKRSHNIWLAMTDAPDEKDERPTLKNGDGNTVLNYKDGKPVSSYEAIESAVKRWSALLVSQPTDIKKFGEDFLRLHSEMKALGIAQAEKAVFVLFLVLVRHRLPAWADTKRAEARAHWGSALAEGEDVSAAADLRQLVDEAIAAEKEPGNRFRNSSHFSVSFSVSSPNMASAASRRFT